MDPRDSEHTQEFLRSLALWKDDRFVSRAQLETMTMFLMYLVNLADHDGWQYDGHSWKESNYLGCLVVKATVDEVPSVVFTNAESAVGGMRIFLRKMKEGRLEWVKDRFRG